MSQNEADKSSAKGADREAAQAAENLRLKVGNEGEPEKNQETSDLTAGSASFQPTDLIPGQLVSDRYKVLSIIGRGGAGAVYKAEHIHMRKQCALKILNSKHITDRTWQRFQKEAQTAGKLEHPNLARALDFGLQENGQAYLVMELVEGETLSQRLKRVGMLELDEIYDIFIPVCLGIGYAHERGIIHRDLKPSNIILSESKDKEGNLIAKVIDFGIAKLLVVDGAQSEGLTKTGEVFGTPLYMSPEQCTGIRVDHRSDIYSIGCVLFEALTGSPPFSADSALVTMMQHQTQEPPTLKQASMGRDFPAGIEKIVKKMLSKNPDDRYQNILDVARDLIALKGNEPIKIGSENSSEASSSTRIIAIIALATLLLIGCWLAWLFWGERNIAGAAKRATDIPANHIEMATGIPNEEPRFSKRIGDIRQFEFPPGVSMGEIVYYDQTGEHRRLAKGSLSFPWQKPLILKADWSVCLMYPHFLRRFDEDELYGLYLLDGDFRQVSHSAKDDIFDQTLVYARSMRSLRVLSVAGTPTTDSGLLNVAELPHLEHLLVSKSKVTGDGISRVKRLRYLNRLFMDGISDPDKVVAAIKGSNTIRHLSMVGTGLKDSDLKGLATITWLKNLNIGNNLGITDRGLAALSKLPELRSLYIDGCGVTPNCGKYLAHYQDLRFLTVDRRWSFQQLAQVQKLLPHCQIKRSSDPKKKMNKSFLGEVYQKEQEQLRRLSPDTSSRAQP